VGEKTGIKWCDHTFNAWWGCTQISPACDNCYAKTWAERFGFTDLWGGTKRRYFGDKHWNEPLKWNRKAEKEGKVHRVFGDSMYDFAEFPWAAMPVKMQIAIARLFNLIEQTPWLEWMLLTKRPTNLLGIIPGKWLFHPPNNLRIGVTVEDQTHTHRINMLLKQWKGKNFVSIEPMLEYVEIEKYITPRWRVLEKTTPSGKMLFQCSVCGRESPSPDKECKTGLDPKESRHCSQYRSLDWVIAGCESGNNARKMYSLWVRILQHKCQQNKVPFFLKQMMIDGKLEKAPFLNDKQYLEFPRC
jgi:protein gp37